MRILLATIISLVFLVSVSSAQSSPSKDDSGFLLGIFGGLNIPRLSGGNSNELSRDYTSRSGIAFGLTSALKLSSKISLKVDLMYSSEGGKRNGIQAFDASSFSSMVPVGTYFYAIYDNESILNYFEIPVMIKYSLSVSKSEQIFADFGPYAGFLLNASQKTRGSSIIYADRAETTVIVGQAQSFDANTTVTKSINPFNLGLSGGVGFTQKVNSSEFFVDLRGSYGLMAIQKNKSDGTSHSGSFLVDIGFAHHF